MPETFKCRLHIMGETKDAIATKLSSGNFEIRSICNAWAIVVNKHIAQRKHDEGDPYFYAC